MARSTRARRPLARQPAPLGAGGVLLTCEHASHAVPRAYAPLFRGRGRRRLLASHRGYDPGALAVARALSRNLGAPLEAGRLTRLLVDLNRSPGNPAVFSELTRALSADERRELLRRHHAPHWGRVRDALSQLRSGVRPRLHLAVHSFAPRLAGRRRRFGVGLLYDPRKERERALCLAWRRELRAAEPSLGVRLNAPYRGDADGLTTALRRELPARTYLGIELELNQRLLRRAEGRRRLVALLVGTLRELLAKRLP